MAITTAIGKYDAKMSLFFARLIDLVHRAYAEPAETCLDVYLHTVGWESAANRGFMHGMWGDLAPAPLVGELEELTTRLLSKAQDGGVNDDVTVGDIAAAVWALRGIIAGSGEAAPDARRRHVTYLLAGFRAPVDHATPP
jgi:hypothetical protein